MTLDHLRELLDYEELQLTLGASAEHPILAVPKGDEVAVYLQFPDDLLTALVADGEVVVRSYGDDDRLRFMHHVGPPANADEDYFERFVIDGDDEEETLDWIHGPDAA